jgi:hypothetical protein
VTGGGGRRAGGRGGAHVPGILDRWMELTSLACERSCVRAPHPFLADLPARRDAPAGSGRG